MKQYRNIHSGLTPEQDIYLEDRVDLAGRTLIRNLAARIHALETGRNRLSEPTANEP
jgi:hypothetical protein